MHCGEGHGQHTQEGLIWEELPGHCQVLLSPHYSGVVMFSLLCSIYKREPQSRAVLPQRRDPCVLVGTGHRHLIKSLARGPLISCYLISKGVTCPAILCMMTRPARQAPSKYILLRGQEDVAEEEGKNMGLDLELSGFHLNFHPYYLCDFREAT